MSNIIEIGGGSGSAVLIPKTINANGVYSASSDSADGYDEVTVTVPTAIESVIPLVSTERFAQTSSYGGTDVSKAVQTFTITEDGVLVFGENSYAVTNTSSNDGYIDIRINGVSITKKYLPSGTNTSFSVPDITVSANDVLTICVGFDNTHSNCWFNVFTAVTLIESGGVPSYEDISSFAFYYNKNTTTPTVTKIDDYEYSISYTDQNATGYELASFSVSLEKGIYIAEIKASVDVNSGINLQYTWGIYSSNTSSGAKLNDNSPLSSAYFSSYVPFDTSDTSEHTYYVPIKMNSAGTAYICFATAADNGTNASISASSIKIKKVA